MVLRYHSTTLIKCINEVGMFCISQILSPLLPAVFVIAQSVASERLRKQKIVCTDMQRISLAGKVKIFCFDKTGTLTKEGLDYAGGHPSGYEWLKTPVEEISGLPRVMRVGMLACHTLSKSGNKVVGNFVDCEMFKASGSEMEMQGEDGVRVIVNHDVMGRDLEREIIVEKRFEFVHAGIHLLVLM